MNFISAFASPNCGTVASTHSFPGEKCIRSTHILTKMKKFDFFFISRVGFGQNNISCYCSFTYMYEIHACELGKMNLFIKFFTADISSVMNNLVLWDTLSQHLFSGGNVKGSFSTWCTLNYYHSATSHGGDRWPLFNSNIYNRSGYKSFLDDQGLPFHANLASKTETSVGPSLVNTRPSIPSFPLVDMPSNGKAQSDQ